MNKIEFGDEKNRSSLVSKLLLIGYEPYDISILDIFINDSKITGKNDVINYITYLIGLPFAAIVRKKEKEIADKVILPFLKNASMQAQDNEDYIYDESKRMFVPRLNFRAKATTDTESNQTVLSAAEAAMKDDANTRSNLKANSKKASPVATPVATSSWNPQKGSLFDRELTEPGFNQDTYTTDLNAENDLSVEGQQIVALQEIEKKREREIKGNPNRMDEEEFEDSIFKKISPFAFKGDRMDVDNKRRRKGGKKSKRRKSKRRKTNKKRRNSRKRRHTKRRR